MLVVVRALGKRTVGNFSAFDLLVALMLGEVVDEIIYGDVRFIQGTVAIVTLAAVAYVGLGAQLCASRHGKRCSRANRPSLSSTASSNVAACAASG